MWNAERPLYFDIFFQTGFTPPCAGQAWIIGMFFLLFYFGQGSCWKLVTGPAWIAISPVPSLMASSSTDQLPFL